MPGSWTTFFCHLIDGTTDINLRDTSWAEGGIFLITLDLGFPATREVVSDAPGRDGVLDYTTYYGSRTVTAALKVKGTATQSVNAILDQLRTISAPNKRILMTVTREGWEAPRQLSLRANAFSCLINKTSHIAADVTMSWVAPNGTMESLATTPLRIQPIFGAAGWLVPSGAVGSSALNVTSGNIDSPALTVLSGTSSNTSTFTNSGSFPAWPVYTIAGLCEDPVIYNRTTGKQLAFKGITIVSGVPLVVDSSKRRATMGGIAADKYIDWTVSSWFSFDPGHSDIEFDASNFDNAAFLDISYVARFI